MTAPECTMSATDKVITLSGKDGPRGFELNMSFRSAWAVATFIVQALAERDWVPGDFKELVAGETTPLDYLEKRLVVANKRVEAAEDGVRQAEEGVWHAERARDELEGRIAKLEAELQAVRAQAALTPERPPVYGVERIAHATAIRRAFAAGIQVNQFGGPDSVQVAWMQSPTRADLRAVLTDDEMAVIDRTQARGKT